MKLCYQNSSASVGASSAQYVLIILACLELQSFQNYVARLFSKEFKHPNSEIFYVFVCRVVMGYYFETKQDMHGTRELTEIPRSDPPVVHHGLLAETGGMKSSEYYTIELELHFSTIPLHHHMHQMHRQVYSSNVPFENKTGRLHRFREFVLYHSNRIYPEYLVAYERK